MFSSTFIALGSLLSLLIFQVDTGSLIPKAIPDDFAITNGNFNIQTLATPSHISPTVISSMTGLNILGWLVCLRMGSRTEPGSVTDLPKITAFKAPLDSISVADCSCPSVRASKKFVPSEMTVHKHHVAETEHPGSCFRERIATYASSV
ncbi:hypothetical protein C8J57DRAFT_1240187 [Mycena rebaudengoi]|nr:hypothetical protein C8J57DRAFT_1240187 [Mycena rebaudengoi]